MPTIRPRRVAAVALTAVLLPTGALVVPTIAAARVTDSPTSGQALAREAPHGASLEDAATRATNTGRTVALQLIGLGLAIAGVVLGLKRDFKEAVGVFAVGILAVLLATPSGIALLRTTVSALFGA